MYDRLNEFEEKHPKLYVVLMFALFFGGCAAIWGLAMLTRFLAHM